MEGVNAQGMMTGASALGTDLRHDHPISFAPAASGAIVNPPAGSPVKLDDTRQVQCRSCHDPHRMDADPTTKKFLVMNNSASALCMICHNQPYWTSGPSTHKTSTKAYSSVQGAHTGYATVQTNGCESCHKPHGAGSPPRGLKAVEELTCGAAGSQCHSSTGIGRNVEAEFRKAYSHGTYNQTPSSHDASESPVSTTPHTAGNVPGCSQACRMPRLPQRRTRPTPPLRRGPRDQGRSRACGHRQQQHCTGAERHARVGERVRNLLQVSW